MRILPILFNTDMVRALLEGPKTVTRRVIKSQPPIDFQYPQADDSDSCWWWTDKDGDDDMMRWWPSYENGLIPPYKPGDILYVRETWSMISEWTNVDPNVGLLDGYIYKADWTDDLRPRWYPSIHMPKEAARIFLRVKSVRVEKLQDITEEQARAEGFYPGWKAKGAATPALTAKQAFMWFWLPDVWTADPWVWVIEFERVDKPEGWPRRK